MLAAGAFLCSPTPGNVHTMNDHPPIDHLEKKIRLGCGVIAGAVSVPLLAAVSFAVGGKWLWALAAIGAVLFAFLALRYGDHFWEWLIEFFKGSAGY